MVCGLKLGITREPRGLTASQSRPADIFTTAGVPGRSAALDVCVASPNAAEARGDAAQASFDRKMSHYRNEISDLRNHGILYRALVWTAGGRPHPAVTRTLQYAADIAPSRNEQQMSAKSLQSRRRAAMTRAVLPNPSARAEWLLDPQCTVASLSAKQDGAHDDRFLHKSHGARTSAKMRKRDFVLDPSSRHGNQRRTSFASSCGNR